jgi:hypothetical protein
MLYLFALGCSLLLVILSAIALIRVLSLRRKRRKIFDSKIERKPQGGERSVRTVEGAKPEVRVGSGF